MNTVGSCGSGVWRAVWGCHELWRPCAVTGCFVFVEAALDRAVRCVCIQEEVFELASEEVSNDEV